MKKILYGMMAATMIFATSCENELEVGAAGEESMVSFTIATPDMGSRADYSDGTTATVLQYAVYDAAGNELEALTVTDGEIHGSTTVNLKLTTGNTYSVIFWAAAEDAPYAVNFANKTMTVDYTNAVSNDESRDAFYKYHTFTVTGAQTEAIELKRPFAQLNIGTNDYAASTSAGYTPTHSAVTVKNLKNTLNFFDGTVTGTEDARVFASAAIPAGQEFPVADYEYLAMNYLLVGADKTVVDVEFTYTNGSDAKTRKVGSVPVQRNYRTNIYGQLLTSDVDVNVEIEPDYQGSHEAEALFLAAAVGGEVTLTGDVVLTAPLEVQANMVINLNDNTISGNWENSKGAVIEVAEGVTLKVVGGTISSTLENGNAAIKNYGTLIVEDATLNGAPNGASGNASYALNSTGENSKLILNNATINGRGAIGATNGTKVEVNGGTYHTPEIAWGHAVYASGAGTEVVINGGTFTEGYVYSSNGWGMYQIYAGDGSKVIVNDGDFSQEWDCANGYDLATSGTGAIEIKGGVFADDPSNQNGKNFVADGYAAVDNGDGTWSVVKALNSSTISTVFENLSTTEPTTIAVTENINIAEPLAIPAGAEVTVNLGDKVITSASTDAFVVNEGATLTISGNGTVKSNGAPIRAIGGTVIVEGGTFTQTGAWNTATSTYRYSIDSREGGEVIIKGGTFNTNNGLISVSANSSVVIDGGEFTFENNTGGTRHFAYVSGGLTINDGVFRGVADGGAGGCFFCGASSTCNIQVNGGKFTSLWTSGSVNSIFESYAGGSSINVTGGLFNTNGGIASFVEANTDAATMAEYPYKAK